MKTEEQILTHILNCRRVDLYTQNKKLNSEQEKMFRLMTSRLSDGEPLQYVLGTVDFMGLTLKVDERVLIPRPETEILVESAIEILKEKSSGALLKILDLGTGSGNIAMAIAKNVSNSFVTTVDISSAAIHLARLNAQENNFENKIQFVCQDMRAFLKEQIQNNNKYDFIISNPPYIPTSYLENLPSNVKHEPKIALNGGEDGLDFYRIIIDAAHLLLERNSFLFFEIGDGQADEIKRIVDDTKEYQSCTFQKDYVGTNRITIIKR